MDLYQLVLTNQPHVWLVLLYQHHPESMKLPHQ